MNKINGIFQALDSQNYKNALKLCNTYLQKKSDAPLVIVLKALSLSKLGEIDEAIKLADSIAFQGHVDENVISNLNYFYRSINQLEKMCKVWEATYKKHPKQEKIAEGVFLSYSKIKDLKNQKDYAVTLSRDFPSPKHSFWYLMTMLSLVMDNPSSSLNVQLTERLSDKLATEGKFTTTEELYIYETILEMQNKYQKYLEIMKGKLGDLYTYQPDKLKQMAKVYEKLEMNKEAAESYKEIITKYEPDEWSCYIGYFNSMEKIEGVDKNEILDLIKTQQNSVNQSKPIRAPFIAELEYANRQKSSNLDELIVSYFKRFGTKPVCYYDLKRYLVNFESAPIEQRQKLFDSLRQLVISVDYSAENSDALAKSSSERVSQLSNIYRVHRSLGLQYQLSTEDRNKLITTLLDEYEKNRVASAATQQISERLSGDDLILLSYHMLTDLGGDVESLGRAAAILEYGHNSSPKNFQFNLALIRIYFKMGATLLAHKHVKILNIKNIQYDTIAYYIFDDLLRGAAYPELYSTLEKASKFYTENDSTPDFVAHSYQKESYSKVLEIQKFQERVANSYQRAANQTESQLLNFFLAQHKYPNDRSAQLNSIPAAYYQLPTEEQIAKFTFNQDLDVQDQWNTSTYRSTSEPTFGFNSFTWNATNNKERLTNQLITRRLILSLIVTSKTTVDPTKGASPIDAKYKELLDKLTDNLTNKLSNDNQFNQTLNSATIKVFNLYYTLRTQLSAGIKLEDIDSTVQSILNEFIDNFKLLSELICKSNDVNKFRMLTSHLELMTWALFVLAEVNKVVPKKQKKRDEIQIELRKRFDQFVKDFQTFAIKNIETNLNLEGLASLTISGENNDQSLPSFVNLNGNSSSIHENIQQTKKLISEYIASLNGLTKFE